MTGRALWLSIWLILVLAIETAPAGADPAQSILVLNESAMVGPFYQGAYAALRATIAAKSPHPVAIYLEQLELERFGGDRYEQTLRTYLKSKYAEQPIGVIVALGFGALDFVSRLKQEMWSAEPVVFVMVDEDALKKLQLPSGVTGRTARVKFRDALNVARAVVPNLQQLAVVGDRWEIQTAYRHFKEEIETDARGLRVLDLVGLPMRELRKRVAVLPEDTAIIYTSIFSDDEGTSYPPVDALALIAQSANRPIVVAAETFVGAGGVGGYVLTPARVGEEAAGIALRILNGESLATIPIEEGDVVRPIFDWRELRRWGIDESRLPVGSEIRFYEPTLWQRYRSQLLAICAAFVVQSALITWLIYEYRRRHAAELTTRDTMAQLTQMNRMATAGELSASIAHELNQPLAAIAMAAGIASRSLVAEKTDLDKVKRTLDQIVDAGLHAGELINSVRGMFKKDASVAVPVNINSVILVVLDLTRYELYKHDIELRTRLNAALPSVCGDPIQLRQVILNLVVNAIEAMQGRRLRVLTVSSELVGSDRVQVSIADTGAGIDPTSAERVFKPLFTTKANGMGMGLAICHSIVESHHGRMWVSAGAENGAVFGFIVPAMAAKHIPLTSLAS